MSDESTPETVNGDDLTYDGLEHHGEIVRARYKHCETGDTYYEVYESTGWVDADENPVTPEY